MRTLNFYLVMKQKWVSGVFLKPHAKQLGSKQCATQSLLNCGGSFIQMSWLQNQWDIFAQLASRTPWNCFERQIFLIMKNQIVLAERNVYREACKEVEHNFKTIEDTIDLCEPHAACSLMQTIHYSFDYAQQVHSYTKQSDAAWPYLFLSAP